MNFAPVDLTEFVATVLGLMVALIPVAGFTLRWTLKPVIEAYARARSPQLAEVHALEARVALLEKQLAELRSPAGLELPVSAPIPELSLPGRAPVRGA